MFTADNILPLAREDYGFGDPIIRLPNHTLKAGMFTRRQPVIVFRPDLPGRFVLRFAMGVGGGVKGFTKRSLSLDYDAARELDIKRDTETRLSVRPASRSEIWWWYWRHDDPVVRMGIRMGGLSVVLGVIGAIAGLISVAGLLV